VVRAEPLVLGVTLEVTSCRAVVAVVFFLVELEPQPAAKPFAVTLALAFLPGLRAAMVVSLATHLVTVASVAAAAAAMTAAAAVVAFLAAAAAEALIPRLVAAAAAAPMPQQIF